MSIRNRILDAAISVFADTGYRGATTRRIAQVADVNEVTLFRHFGSKEDLLREAVQQIAAEAGEITLPEEPTDPVAELTQWAHAQHARLVHLAPVIRTCMGESTEHPEMARCAQNHPLRVSTQLRTYLGALQRLGFADPDLDVGSATGLLIGALFNDALGRAVMPELFSYPAEDAPARYVKLFVRAISVRKSSETSTQPGQNDV